MPRWHSGKPLLQPAPHRQPAFFCGFHQCPHDGWSNPQISCARRFCKISLGISHERTEIVNNPDPWSGRLVCNYLGQHGPCLVWGWGSQWLLSTGAGSLLWSRCYSGYLWGFSMCPQGDVSIDCCGSHQVQGPWVWPLRWNAWDPSTWRVCCRLQYCQKWSRFGPSHPVPWLPGILHCSGQRRSYLWMLLHAHWQ